MTDHKKAWQIECRQTAAQQRDIARLSCEVTRLTEALEHIGDAHIDDLTEIFDYARAASKGTK